MTQFIHSLSFTFIHFAQTPEKWNMQSLFFISTILAIVACVSSLLLLIAGLESWEEGSVFQEMGVGGLSYGQIITMMYMKVREST
jgi:hypothetical protein